MTPELINKITNIIAVIVGVGTVIVDTLGQVEPGSRWYAYAGALAVAIILYFTGKSAVALKKKNNQLR